jgi:DNA-directed RNA polymerase subunit RPC12/RpoP
MRTWMVAYRCESCEETFQHIEVSLDDDDPYGLPPGVECPECGGTLQKLDEVQT